MTGGPSGRLLIPAIHRIGGTPQRLTTLGSRLSTAFAGNHTLTVREYTAYSYFPLDPKVYDIDNLREVSVLYATATVVSSSANPSTFGHPATLTATVTTTPSGDTPTGSVLFEDGGTILGARTLGGGMATLTTSTLAVGSHGITAVYVGDANDAGSTSPRADRKRPLRHRDRGFLLGQPLDLRPTGDLDRHGHDDALGRHADGQRPLRGRRHNLGARTLNGGTATLTTSTLAVGSHSITAVYVGDLNDAGSTSSAMTQTVNVAALTAGPLSPPGGTGAPHGQYLRYGPDFLP